MIVGGQIAGIRRLSPFYTQLDAQLAAMTLGVGCRCPHYPQARMNSDICWQGCGEDSVI